MGEKPGAQDEQVSETERAGSKPNIANIRREAGGPAAGEQAAEGAERSAGAPLKGVDVKLG